MPSQPPPRRPSAKAEGRGKNHDGVSPIEKFKRLAARLLDVSKEDVDNQQRRYEETRRQGEE